jgi:hypothetical protein
MRCKNDDGVGDVVGPVHAAHGDIDRHVVVKKFRKPLIPILVILSAAKDLAE